MATNKLTRLNDSFPSVFEDFFKPWNDWADMKGMKNGITVPAANITEEKDCFKVALASPGFKKDDFSIDVEGNILTISAENEESKEEKEKKYTRQEYSYNSFSRSFTLPGEINKDKIAATYDKGILTLSLPKTENGKTSKKHKVAIK